MKTVNVVNHPKDLAEIYVKNFLNPMYQAQSIIEF